MAIYPYFSQFGEDRILAKIFAGKKTGVCVEVGGYDGITGSNSYGTFIHMTISVLTEQAATIGTPSPRTMIWSLESASRKQK